MYDVNYLLTDRPLKNHLYDKTIDSYKFLELVAKDTRKIPECLNYDRLPLFENSTRGHK